ncbi:MAG: hypothetical protein PHT05_05170 [Clostridia bacterium]|nr:hypothetical protein [Clostridia bacterium]
MRTRLNLIMSISVIMSILLVTAACSTNKKASVNEQYLVINNDGSYFENAMLYFSGDRLLYLDYETLDATFACNKPNCDHSDPELCTAYGKGLSPFVYKGHLYFFNQSSEWGSDGLLVHKTTLYKSKYSGTEQVKIATIDDISPNLGRYYLLEDTLYFTAYSYPKEAENDLLYIAIHLYSINLDTGEVSHLLKFKEGGNNISVVVNGVFDNKVYYELYYYERQIQWHEWLEDKVPEPIHENLIFNIETGEIIENHLPSPEIIANGSYFYNEKNEYGEYEFKRLDMLTNKEQVLHKGFNCAVPSFVDNKLFFYIAKDHDDKLGPVFSENHEEYFYDFKTDRVEKLKKDIPNNITLFPRVRYKDKYIFVLTDVFDMDITGSIGQISIDDFHNGMNNYELSPVDFSNKVPIGG